VIWLVVLIICLGGPLIGYKLGQYFFGTKQKRLPPEALNVINGLVLPEPDDPRWHIIGKGASFSFGNSINLCVGKIWFYDKGGGAISFSDHKLVAYYNAIHHSFMSAIAFDSILNAKMPPKPKKLKAPKVEVVSSGPPDRSLAEIIKDPPKLQLKSPQHMYKWTETVGAGRMSLHSPDCWCFRPMIGANKSF